MAWSTACAMLLGATVQALYAGVVPARLAAQSSTESDSAFIAAHYIKREVRIAMRDGVRLFTTVYAPRDTSRTVPCPWKRTDPTCAW